MLPCDTIAAASAPVRPSCAVISPPLPGTWLRALVTLALVATAVPLPVAHAARTVVTVDSTAQEVPFVTNGNCTLGEAIRSANTDTGLDACGGDPHFGTGGPFVIELQNTTYTLTQPENWWYGPTGLPEITSDITVNGHGATITRSSAPGIPKFRLFTMDLVAIARKNNGGTTDLALPPAILGGGAVDARSPVIVFISS